MNYKEQEIKEVLEVYRKLYAAEKEPFFQEAELVLLNCILHYFKEMLCSKNLTNDEIIIKIKNSDSLETLFKELGESSIPYIEYQKLMNIHSKNIRKNICLSVLTNLEKLASTQNSL